MTWSRLLPVGVFLILVIFLAIGLTRDPSVIPTEMIDREMPDFELPDASGRPVRFHADRAESKAALVFYRSAVW